MTVKSIKLIALSALMSMPVIPVEAQNTPRYQVAVCDWMILKRQKLGEFSKAREVGADGVEVDMGPLGKRVLFENRFRIFFCHLLLFLCSFPLALFDL